MSSSSKQEKLIHRKNSGIFDHTNRDEEENNVQSLELKTATASNPKSTTSDNINRQRSRSRSSTIGSIVLREQSSNQLTVVISRKPRKYYLDCVTNTKCTSCSAENPATWLCMNTHVRVDEKKYILHWLSNVILNESAEVRYLEKYHNENESMVIMLCYIWIVLIVYIIFTSVEAKGESMNKDENSWYLPYLSLRLIPVLVMSTVTFPALLVYKKRCRQYWATLVTLVIVVPAIVLMISASTKQAILRQSLAFNLDAMQTGINSACPPNMTHASLSTIVYKDPTSLLMSNLQTLNENLFATTKWFDKYTVDIEEI
jgi:membrane-associated HD superfamily phosphohydrolase